MPSLEWKILLVDDDRDDFVLVRDIVSEFGGRSSRLSWTAKYDVAAEELVHNRHDVYLIDYHLGERNGLDLMREGVAGGCTAPLILLTGQANLSADEEAMAAGALDYLEKGRIDPVTLERSIRYAIESKRSESLLSKRTQALEESNARLRNVTARVTDRLVAPLANLIDTLDALAANVQDDAERAELIRQARDAAQVMRERVDQRMHTLGGRPQGDSDSVD